MSPREYWQVLFESSKLHGQSNRWGTGYARKPCRRSFRSTRILQFCDRKFPYWSIQPEGDHHSLHQQLQPPKLLLMDMSFRNSRGLSMPDLHWDDCSKCIGLECKGDKELRMSHCDKTGKLTHSKLTIQTTRAMLITTIRTVSHNRGNEARKSEDRLHFAGECEPNSRVKNLQQFRFKMKILLH